jgi:hypothetical protein
MVLSIDMYPADRDINRKAFIKIHAASPSSYKNPSKYTPPRTVVGNYERTVQVRYANGMRKTR